MPRAFFLYWQPKTTPGSAGGENSLWRGAKKTRKSLRVRVKKDHIHMLISIPPKYSVSQTMGYLKGKSSMMIFDRHANLKYKYGNRHFWERGYFVDTVGRNKKAIKAYIQNQLEEDKMSDQISIKEFIDPFTGSKNPKAQIKPLKGLRP